MTYHPRHISWLEVEIEDGPDTGLSIAPKTMNDVIAVLRYATEQGLVVQVWGGGTHSGYGTPPQPDLVMSMERLGKIEAWEPDDLTIVVGAGASIADVETELSQRNQSLVMSERPGRGTIGGAIAAGVSPLRRGRLYGVRERVLEVTMVTGDGRVVRSGGRVVKNVTGYDLHRLAVGAFGSLGVIMTVCLKLWPTPPAAATVVVDDVEGASVITRPLAVLDVDGETKVYVWGTEREVEALVARLGDDAKPGLDWPDDPTDSWQWSIRVPPSMTGQAISRLPARWRYLAVHGVGEVRAASPSPDSAADLRSWVGSVGGHLVMTKGRPDQFDPWGSTPPGVDIQRRLIAQFDPRRVINPGRLPGGL